eukprot:1051646-Pyramimonas_sp.AAC.1
MDNPPGKNHRSPRSHLAPHPPPRTWAEGGRGSRLLRWLGLRLRAPSLLCLMSGRLYLGLVLRPLSDVR